MPRGVIPGAPPILACSPDEILRLRGRVVNQLLQSPDCFRLLAADLHAQMAWGELAPGVGERSLAALERLEEDARIGQAFGSGRPPFGLQVFAESYSLAWLLRLSQEELDAWQVLNALGEEG